MYQSAAELRSGVPFCSLFKSAPVLSQPVFRKNIPIRRQRAVCVYVCVCVRVADPVHVIKCAA